MMFDTAPVRYPRQESNLCTWFRKPLLYPLSYGGLLPRPLPVVSGQLKSQPECMVGSGLQLIFRIQIQRVTARSWPALFVDTGIRKPGQKKHGK